MGGVVVTDFYGLEGQPISKDEYLALMGAKADVRRDNPESAPDHDPTRIGSDHVGDAWVSTVWLGIDHGFGYGAPILFETMVFGGEFDEWCLRYQTRAEALDGHRRVVAALQAGVDLGELE